METNQSSITSCADEEIRVTAIMPVYNGSKFLHQTLPPLLAMLKRDELLEVVVVDDGSNDGSPDIARSLGARVIYTGGLRNVGAARNIGSEAAQGDILWFVDADVIVHDDAATLISQAFHEPGVVAVFGSYDDNPPAQNFLSQYKNLVHHFYHQRAKQEASTFWSGCGAARKTAFDSVGGFDSKRYKFPSIEDIELGYRLRAAGGAIRLIPNLHGTHLKVWRLGNLIHTEIFRRAIPWARLMLERGAITNDLNVGVAERIRAALAGIWFLSGTTIVVEPRAFWAFAALTLIVCLANFNLMKLFYQRKGPLFALGGILFHQLYYLYSAVSFVWSVLRYRIARPAS